MRAADVLLEFNATGAFACRRHHSHRDGAALFPSIPPRFFANVGQTVISFDHGEEDGFSPMGCAKLLIVGLPERLRIAEAWRHETGWKTATGRLA
jgi:hypothetical protein